MAVVGIAMQCSAQEVLGKAEENAMQHPQHSMDVLKHSMVVCAGADGDMPAAM